MITGATGAKEGGPIFRRPSPERSNLFWLEGERTTAPLVCIVGVLAREIPSGRQAAVEATLDDLLQWNPLFLFLDPRASDATAIAWKLNDDPEVREQEGVGMVWLSGSPGQTRGLRLEFTQRWRWKFFNRDKPFTCESILPFGSHGLKVHAKASIQRLSQGTGNPAALEIALADGAALFGRYDGKVVPDPAAYGHRLTLALDGERAGCFSGTLKANAAVLASIGAVSRWRLDGNVLAFPLLYPDGDLEFEAMIDPLRPQDASRTWLELKPGGQIRSGFRSRRGEEIALVPIPGSDAFRAGPRLVLDKGGLGLEGSFSVLPKTDRTILCGLNGREFLLLSQGAVFTVVRDGDGTGRIKVSGPGKNLHIRNAGTDVGTGGVRTELTADSPPLPLLPCGFTMEDAGSCARLDETVLAPERRRLLARPDPPPPSYVTVGAPLQPVGSAPGLQRPRRKGKADDGWTFLDAPDGTAANTALFGDPGTPYRMALSGLTKREIGQIASSQNYDLALADGGDVQGGLCEITIGPDCLRSPLGTWSGGHGMIIVKRTQGRPLADIDAWRPLIWRVGDGPEAAIDPRLATDIQAVGRQVEAAVRAGHPDFSTLNDKIFKNPSWTGVLMANVPLAELSLPKPVAGMMNGLLRRVSRRQPTCLWLAWSFDKDSGIPVATTLLDFPSPARPARTPLTAASLHRITATPRLLADPGQGWQAEIAVGMDRLLGEPLLPENAPLRIQVHRGADGGESMQLATPAVFRSKDRNRRAVDAVTVTEAGMKSIKTRAGVELRFDLSGTLRLRTLPADLLSFGAAKAGAEGGLVYSRLELVVFKGNGQAEISLEDAALAFDATRSVCRAGSLFAGFPLGPPRLIRDQQGKPPGDLGFIAVACPAATARVDKGWLGLAHRLDLGGMGSAVGGAGLAAELLIAWQPGSDGVQVGLKLPGSGSDRPEIAAGGVVRLGFDSVALAPPGDGGGTAWTLRLEAIRLSLMGIGGVPPGRADLVLIGDPQRRETSPGLGWCLAYVDDGKSKEGSVNGGKRSRSSSGLQD
ncbi:hypothetical protein [Azospirillum sp. sgz302134]